MHKQKPKRIVLATFGSLGDLHPYMALALGLSARGHEAVIATSEIYREKIEGAGLGFFPVRPDLPRPEKSDALMKKIMDERKGPDVLFNQILMPALKDSYDDLFAATEGADLLIAHTIVFAAPMVAQMRSLRWVSIALQPVMYLSEYDPPALPVPGIAGIYRLGPVAIRLFLSLAKKAQSSWIKPVPRLRQELGLPKAAGTDFDMQISPYLDLALFSRALASPQPDWPEQTRQCGFCFYDRLDNKEGLSPEIEAFVNAGPPPVTFTLGSSAVMSPGKFYQESIEAIRKLKQRALLLVGTDPGGILSQKLPEGILAAPYAPYSEVFPRSAVIVHQGGVGTTGQALRAGRPQLVVPFAYDQPDNGARVGRRGAGSVLHRRRYKADRVAVEIHALLLADIVSERAKKLADMVRWDHGVSTACDAIEEQLLRGHVV